MVCTGEKLSTLPKWLHTCSLVKKKRFLSLPMSAPTLFRHSLWRHAILHNGLNSDSQQKIIFTVLLSYQLFTICFSSIYCTWYGYTIAHDFKNSFLTLVLSQRQVSRVQTFASAANVNILNSVVKRVGPETRISLDMKQ